MSQERGRYDLIVVGGGIHGVCVALESARRGWRPLLLECDGFGEATSANHQRIIHGGLRYLQSLDLKRTLESAREQRWFLEHFPDLVRPLPCLMPLYGDGLRTPWAFAAALLAYGLLSRGRRIGRVLNVAETRARFPAVRPEALKGAGLWWDALMVDPYQLLHQLLGWAIACGASARNHVRVDRLLVERGRAMGVEAGGQQFHADVVVNCAGPWCRELAASMDRDIPRLMYPSLGFCVLLDHAPLSDAALAVAPPEPGSPTYFLVPWNGAILAGTGHVAWNGVIDHAAPTDAQVQRMLDALNAAVPGFNATRERIVQRFCGILPAVKPGSPEPSNRSLVIEHARGGGPVGLWSVSGVKYTTARLVAEHTVRRIFGSRRYRPGTGRPPSPGNSHQSSSSDERVLRKA
jgi:glycerol-3-phosphate dehydrogenase